MEHKALDGLERDRTTVHRVILSALLDSVKQIDYFLTRHWAALSNCF